MAIKNRLRILGHYGISESETVAYNVMVKDLLASATSRRALKGLRSYEFGKGKVALGFTYSHRWPALYNAAAAWSFISGTDGREDLPHPFGNNSAAVGHSIGTANAPVHYRLGSIPENGPWALQLYRFAVDSGQTVDLWWAVWDRWRLELRKGECRLMRIANSYTDPGTGTTIIITAAVRDSLQTSLDALLANDPMTALQSDQADVIRKQLYASDDTVDLNSGSDRSCNTPVTLTFIPDSRGVLAVEVKGQPRGTLYVENTDILNTRTTGTMWRAGALDVGTTGGQFVLQFGYPQFEVKGSVGLGRLTFQRDMSGASLTARAFTPPGTTAVLTRTPVFPYAPGPPATADVSDYTVEMTGDGTFTPLLYSAEIFAPASERDGSDAVQWDSAQHELPGGLSLIESVDTSIEDESRRMHATVTLLASKRDDGTVMLNDGTTFPICHDCLCILDDDHGAVMTGALIAKVQWSDMAQAASPNPSLEDQALGAFVDPLFARSNSRLVLQLDNRWRILEDALIMRELIFDNLHLTDALNRILECVGERAAERAGIPSGQGKIITAAAVGEPPAEKTTVGCKASETCIRLVREYGLGGHQYWDEQAGRWTFAFQSGAVKIALSTDPATLPPGRGESPIDIVDDFSGTYNAFMVIGDEDPVTKIAVWSAVFIYEGFVAPPVGTTPDPRYIGRLRWYPPVTDKSKKTETDCYYAALTLARKMGRAGRFMQCGTYVHNGIYSEDGATIDGVEGTVERVLSSRTSDRVAVEFPGVGGRSKLLVRRT